MPKGVYKRNKSMNSGKHKRTYEQRKHLSEIRFRLTKRGDKSNFWKGGIDKTIIDKKIRLLSKYKQWRSNCFERDNWTCQTCGKRGVYLTVHHIKSFVSILRENNILTTHDADKCIMLWDIENGVTLCEECHKLTDNYKGRGACKKKKK